MASRTVFVVTASLLLASCGDRPTTTPIASAAAALRGGDEAEAYSRALAPHDFSFPADHGAHPDFKTEWWYLTGHLATDAGRRFGYQLTFFRQALAATQPERASRWATRQMYMAHFAVTDVDADRFYADERLSRAAAGLAGATASPWQVWLDDWQIASLSTGTFPAKLQASSADVTLELTLDQRRPPLLHGDRGLSRKGAGAGNASFYFSLTRLHAAGRLTVDGVAHQVNGDSWLDREWFTGVLDRDQIGWDWFSLALDDGRDLMVFQTRQSDGSSSALGRQGTLGGADGVIRTLQGEDFTVEVLDHWQSPRGGSYPARWRLTVPQAALDLEVVPLIADQELDVSFRYWEGAVDARGRSDGHEISGRGYVELVGYAR